MEPAPQLVPPARPSSPAPDQPPALNPRQRLNAGASTDVSESSTDATGTAPTSRPQRDWKKKPVRGGDIPQAGDIIAVGKTGKKNLAVVKRLGGGAFGEVFVVEDQGGQLSILKQQKPLLEEPPQLGDPSYGGYKERVKRGKGKLLTEKELLTKAAEHEVDMQNFTARALKQARDAGRDVGDFADEAELVGQGRIKQRYAGANFGQLFEDVDGLTDDGLREASARVLLTRMLQAAAALDAVDVVHRDLHLGNVALDDAGRPKLLDFGLAKRKGDRDVQLEMSSGIGADGQYGQNVPPEARTAKNRFDTSFASSHKADVYSIGEVFQKTLDPERAFTPLVKSPRKELVELVRELGADNPDDRPTAAEALTRLAKMKTPAEVASESNAETLLRGFARTRIQKALAEPPAPTVASGASNQ
jgi:serine/threonine protein kinase